MSVIGKGTLSIKKTEVKEQKNVALGFKKVKFAHQASAGDTGFNLGTLVTPSDMSTLGFVQPSAATLLKGNLFTFRNNLKLVSSLRGLLIDQLSYVVSSSSQITFVGFTAAEGEIFVGHFDEAPATSLNVVDGNQIVASGILTAGQTDFNIGTPIEINKNPGSQMGSVMVFADRGLQYRKVGNITTGDGDYIEVPVAGGVGSLIRFNASAVDRYITVVSNGVVAERPDGSMMAAIERVQGQVDTMVPVLAAAAGVPTTTFQTAPNNVDLKQFGDSLLATQNTVAGFNSRLTTLESWPQAVELYLGGGNSGGSGSFRRRFVTVYRNTLGSYATYTDDPVQGGYVTVLKSGIYCISYMDEGSGGYATIGITIGENSSTVNTQLTNLTFAQGYRGFVDTASAGLNNTHTLIVFINAGETVRCAYTAASPVSSSGYNQTWFSMSKVI